jgi:bacteriorhodopsin
VKTQHTPVNEKDIILKDALLIENVVQFVEICFYIWFTSIVSKEMYPSDIAKYRYIDWVFTTPTMILSTVAYFHYNNIESKIGFRIHEFAKEHWKTISFMFINNWLMLLMGFLQEINFISIIYSTIFGFVFFGLLFYTMYINFSSLSTKNSIVFATMFILWAAYGIVALNSKDFKNVSYNILDVFSKNFYGLFLVYTINKLRINS